MKTETAVKLMETASELYWLLDEQEWLQTTAAKERLRKVLFELDIFRNDTMHEEPDEWR